MDPAAGPTLGDLKAWVQKGGGPRLKELRLPDRSSWQKGETDGVRKACEVRGVRMKLKSIFDSLDG